MRTKRFERFLTRVASRLSRSTKRSKRKGDGECRLRRAIQAMTVAGEEEDRAEVGQDRGGVSRGQGAVGRGAVTGRVGGDIGRGARTGRTENWTLVTDPKLNDRKWSILRSSGRGSARRREPNTKVSSRG